MHEIKAGECYRLVNGQIVRVTSLTEVTARCDIFDDGEKKWVQFYTSSGKAPNHPAFQGARE